MSYKLVAIDLDDTLLTHDKNISQENIEAIKKAYDNGIYIVISTGRIYASAHAYADILGFKPFIIASDGGIIRDPENKEIYESVMDINEIKYLMKLCNEFDLYYHFYSDMKVFSLKITNKYKKYEQWNKLYAQIARVKMEEISGVLDEVDKMQDKIVKFVTLDDDVNKIKTVREIIDKHGTLESTSSFFNNIEITNKGISKGNALKILGAYLDIKKEDMIAIGDSENDLEMIKYAGLGVAMENAIDLVKENAQYITKSNMDNGVAHVIKKFVL